MMAHHASFALNQIRNGLKDFSEDIYQHRPTPPSRIEHITTSQKFLPLAAILSIEMKKRIKKEILERPMYC